jgi:hypothetical protein
MNNVIHCVNNIKLFYNKSSIIQIDINEEYQKLSLSMKNIPNDKKNKILLLLHKFIVLLNDTYVSEDIEIALCDEIIKTFDCPDIPLGNNITDTKKSTMSIIQQYNNILFNLMLSLEHRQEELSQFSIMLTNADNEHDKKNISLNIRHINEKIQKLERKINKYEKLQDKL